MKDVYIIMMFTLLTGRWPHLLCGKETFSLDVKVLPFFVEEQVSPSIRPFLIFPVQNQPPLSLFLNHFK
jgi:hypothetical protein